MEYGQRIQFRFIRNGLLKGENCIYITHNDDIELIENEMKNNDIDVEGFNKKGLLNIYKIPDIMKHPKGLIGGAEEIISKMFYGLEPPFRLVARMIDEINTKEQIEANLALEQAYHSKFHRFNGLLLCPYDVSNNPLNTHGKWVETILENHHSAIFVTETIEQGITFDMN
ncbi:MAG: MEDS domain-containing protein [Thermoproteota archaeon]|nr:MEDS domain-containing protein [Thermoproteota archaeon]